MKRTTKVILAGLVAASLVGCGEEQQAPPPPAPAKPAAAAAAKPAAAAADAAPKYVYSYNPTVKRDPFRSPVDEGAVAGNNPTCNEPLCQYNIDQLSLVAVVTGDSNPIAMVEDPSSRGYIVRRGSRMGKQGGKVSQILRDSVVVTEFWTGPDGKVQPNPVSLKLSAEKSSSLDMDLLQGKPYAP